MKYIGLLLILALTQINIAIETKTALTNQIISLWPFIIAIPSAGLTEEATEETVIAQSIIDMIIETPDDLIIVDFKTDRVTESQIPERAKLYTKQLNLYAKAASQILNKNVAQAYLYLTTSEKAVRIKT